LLLATSGGRSAGEGGQGWSNVLLEHPANTDLKKCNGENEREEVEEEPLFVVVTCAMSHAVGIGCSKENILPFILRV